MVNTEWLRNQYNKIIFWGAIEKKLLKYVPYVSEKDYVIDDEEKEIKCVLGMPVYVPSMLKNELNNTRSVAIVIMSLEYESEIYASIRKMGFRGDVYADDMVIIENPIKYQNQIVTDGAYTVEKHTQILISLLKEYGVRNIIASPGICNMNFVYSVKSDSYFKVWSCIDERSAAYMACGMAQTTGEMVAISCTGATASRNYMSALTEAFYSHLPIIAITSSRDSFMIGNAIEQVTDRQHLPADIVKESIELSEIHSITERRYCELKINRVLAMARMHGGGPVHINLITHFQKDFTTKTLPKCRKIEIVCAEEDRKFPDIKGKVGIYIRPNTMMTKKTVQLIEMFCEIYDAVVLGDHLSNYTGKYFVNYRLLANKSNSLSFNILIYTGTINSEINIACEKSWRIGIDGAIEDSFLNQEFYFDMTLDTFLKFYIENSDKEVQSGNELFRSLKGEYDRLIRSIPELPFSNIWIAKELAPRIPRNSVCYFGIYSTLRNWNYFELDKSINCFSTVGGYGIDGTLSAMLGASFVNSESLHFCFLGDLSFFYDLNSVGNRHIGNNVRIMVFNNNGGNSLLHYNGLPRNQETNEYVGARNHFSNSEENTQGIEAYVKALGFIYLSARNKMEFRNQENLFLNHSDKPILFEVKYAELSDFKAVDIINELK